MSILTKRVDNVDLDLKVVNSKIANIETNDRYGKGDK